ncbi:FAD-binding oxidoreductase [Robbsia andropogonis]|uniref:FAD-binding oxidoreductase n=1 Tax=Robbsia andropogonis TaxID=28092 RepID=UPI00046778A4|nr:FAD-binding oxidoreductase [Robbsia andropogonis]MCP1116873.1 FAD-binding oxidoreductase [Robbsia andropogonis]MCP1126448.1 FAD-binding oxidoreductase [Robbsia andropogonis]
MTHVDKTTVAVFPGAGRERLDGASTPLDAAMQAHAGTAAFSDILINAFGVDEVTSGSALGSRRFRDWSDTHGVAPIAVLRPRSVDSLSRMLAFCHAHDQKVVTQGGLSGLAGGANILGGEVALSLERMQAIEEIDTVSATIQVQAGAILQRVQEAAEAAGMLMPLDLGARGSCTIGGNLATNAGGNRVIKYGMARESVLGLEAVFADGTIVSDLHKMVKNNSGYDLKQLLIGSEGTLAVITRAVLRLAPRPRAIATAWCGLPSFAAVTTLLARARSHLSGGVSAFEVMWPSYYDFVTTRVSGLKAPLHGAHAFHVLLESEGTDPERHAEDVEVLLAALMDEGVIEDAVLAASTSDAVALWRVRDATAEFPVLMPGLIGFDISFPIVDLEAVAAECAAALQMRWPDITTLFYGHLGDGNLHVIAHHPAPPPGLEQAVDAMVYDITRRWRGAVSAEHGIGRKKRGYLGHTRDAGAMAAMLAIKRAIDPRNILNPGKVIALPESGTSAATSGGASC